MGCIAHATVFKTLFGFSTIPGVFPGLGCGFMRPLPLPRPEGSGGSPVFILDVVRLFCRPALCSGTGFVTMHRIVVCAVSCIFWFSFSAVFLSRFDGSRASCFPFMGTLCSFVLFHILELVIFQWCCFHAALYDLTHW